MYSRQQKLIELYQRVKAFLAEHPAPEAPGFTAAREKFEALVAQVTDHSTAQLMGRQLTRAESQRVKSLMSKLRVYHMKPIVTIARAEIDQQPGITEAFQLPHGSVGAVKLLAAAKAMRESAQLYQPVFVGAGRPADFLDRLTAAMTAVESALGGHARNVGTRVGANVGLTRGLSRARNALELLDPIVREAYEGNQVVLAKWKAAKRLRGVPAPAGTAEPEAAAPTPDIGPSTPVTTPTAA